MTVKMGALEGVFDVFVLFHAGSGSPLHALMSCCGVWCWPSNLLWRFGPGVHPSLLPLSHTQMHSVHTLSTLHTQTDTHSFTSPAGNAPLHSPAAPCWWWNEEECAPIFVFYVMCLELEYVTSLCVSMHMYMYADRMTLILTVRTVNETYSWHEKDNYSSSPHVYFLCVFFPPTHLPSPPKKPTFLFRQPAWPSKCTIAFLCELSCFPVC